MKKDTLINLATALAAGAAFLLVIARLSPRQDAFSEAEARPTPTPRPLPPGVTLLSFADLEKTTPDANYLPLYPPGLKALNGKQVRLVGFMAPFDSLTSLKTFMLFPTPAGCNFCAPPAPNQYILVRQRDAAKHPYIENPIEITGKLVLWTTESGIPADSENFFVYTMEDAEVVELDANAVAPDQHFF